MGAKTSSRAKADDQQEAGDRERPCHFSPARQLFTADATISRSSLDRLGWSGSEHTSPAMRVATGQHQPPLVNAG